MRIGLGFRIRFMKQARFQEHELGNGQVGLLLEGIKARLECLWGDFWVVASLISQLQISLLIGLKLVGFAVTCNAYSAG